MIGNDIVDLKHSIPENKASNLLWLKKVFIDTEIDRIYKCQNPNLLLWQMWSMKEAAYKISLKLGAERAFNPKKFETSTDADNYGKVISVWGIYKTMSIINNDFVHTLASFNEVEFPVYGQAESVNSAHSAEVRKSLIHHFYELNPDAYDISIQMQQDIPALFSGTKKLTQDISLSHHGNYIAWAFTK